MPEQRPYDDPDYRAMAKLLKANPNTLCTFGCGRIATTIDHDPPLAHHHHTRGTGCCHLQPACKPCQDRQGAHIVNNLRSTGYNWP